MTKRGDAEVKRLKMERLHYELMGDIDNRPLWEALVKAEEDYFDACLPSWSLRWRLTHIPPCDGGIPLPPWWGKKQPFRDLDARSNRAALRRAVKRTAAALDKNRQDIALKAAHQGALDALEIYQTWPSFLTPEELERATVVRS